LPKGEFTAASAKDRNYDEFGERGKSSREEKP